MKTILDIIEDRARYYGLDTDNRTETTLRVMAPSDLMVWLDISTEGDDLFVAFNALSPEMEVISPVKDEALGTKHPVESVLDFEDMFRLLVPLVELDDLPNRPDIKALWTGTGLWFLIEEIGVCSDHMHIISKTGIMMVVPTGQGIVMPYKKH